MCAITVCAIDKGSVEEGWTSNQLKTIREMLIPRYQFITNKDIETTWYHTNRMLHRIKPITNEIWWFFSFDVSFIVDTMICMRVSTYQSIQKSIRKSIVNRKSTHMDMWML